VQNVGTGPALKVRLVVDFGDVDGNRSAAGIAANGEATVSAIAARSLARVRVEHRGIAGTTYGEPMMGFVFNLSYEDVSGVARGTRGRYSGREDRIVDFDLIDHRMGEADKLGLAPPAL
jgi:hypothetical protein